MFFLHPDKQFERFEDVTPEILQKNHVRLILCDLDNTLTERLSKYPAETLEKWISDIREANINIVVVSNNVFKKRVQRFCKPYQIECVWFAKKPLSKNLTKTRENLGYLKKNTIMLGDKYTTDVLAAKFAGIRAWKVESRKKVTKSDNK